MDAHYDTLWESQVPGEGREEASVEITVVFLSSILFESPRSQERGGRRRTKRSLLCFSLRYSLEAQVPGEGREDAGEETPLELAGEGQDASRLLDPALENKKKNMLELENIKICNLQAKINYSMHDVALEIKIQKTVIGYQKAKNVI